MINHAHQNCTAMIVNSNRCENYQKLKSYSSAFKKVVLKINLHKTRPDDVSFIKYLYQVYI